MSYPIHCEERPVLLDGGDRIAAVIGYPDGTASRDTPVVILAHGAGTDMRSPFLSAIHDGLAGRGYVTVKFNFPYKDRGRRLPDRAPILEACYARALQSIRADRPQARIVIGGKSLGGRIASHLAAGGADIAGLILLGYPLHPARRPDQLRAAHLSRIRVPMLFLSGSRDALCDLGLLRQVLAELSAPWQLHVVAGADHSFHVQKAAQRADSTAWAEIVDVSARWLQQLNP